MTSNDKHEAPLVDAIKSWFVMPDASARAEIPGPLNHDVALEVAANCFMAAISPKRGTLSVGERGLDFRAEKGSGYVLIPYANVVQIVADVQGKNVRSIEVVTDQMNRIPFVVEHGAELVRVLSRYIDREQLVGHVGNFKRAWRRICSRFSHS